jgi:GNAT superfamily N-acetyltransferase
MSAAPEVPSPSAVSPGGSASGITVAVEEGIGVEEYLTVMAGSGLDSRRPYDDPDRMGVILARSGPIVGARTADGLLVGVARCITDGGFATFLIDLAVVEAHQGQGIAREMVEQVIDACHRTVVIASAAPDVDAFYDHLGLRRHHSTWYELPADLDGFPQPPAAT